MLPELVASNDACKTENPAAMGKEWKEKGEGRERRQVRWHRWQREVTRVVAGRDPLVTSEC